jgi:hypothetical protein
VKTKGKAGGGGKVSKHPKATDGINKGMLPSRTAKIGKDGSPKSVDQWSKRS